MGIRSRFLDPDLVRRLDFPLEMDFICVSSYGAAKESSGRIKLRLEPAMGIKDRHVLVVDDIVDSGLTTNFILDWLRRKKPASLGLCALMDKPSRRRVTVNIDYLGFTVPDRFMVGYGLDFGEDFRNLPEICFIDGE